jgi:hypothetical protein
MDKSFLRTTLVLAMLSVAGLAGGVIGCATGRTSIPTAEELGAAGSLPKGADLGALRRGRAILVTECATCHKLFLPDEYSREEWPGIIARMARRASLGEEQAADLLLYLSATSRVGN